MTKLKSIIFFQFFFGISLAQQIPIEKEMSFLLDSNYESHSWSVLDDFICHVQYSPNNFHLNIFDKSLSVAEDHVIQVPEKLLKRRSVFRDSCFLAWYKNENKYWAIKFNPFTSEKWILEGEITNKLVLDNVLLNPNSILVQTRNRFGSKYSYKLHSFEDNSMSSDSQKGRVTYFVDQKKSYTILTKNSLQTFDHKLDIQSNTVYDWGDECGKIQQLSIVEINGNLNVFGLAYFNKISNPGWNLLHGKIEDNYLKNIEILPITRFDQFFDYEMENKDKLLAKRDELASNGKAFPHEFSLVAHSPIKKNNGVLIVIDIARAIEELEEAFGIEDEDKWIITGYEYLYSLCISYTEENDLSKYEDEYFDLYTKEISDPLALTFGGILFGLDGDPFLPYSKRLEPITFTLNSDKHMNVASYRGGYLKTKHLFADDDYSFFELDDKFDLQKKERIEGEYIHHWYGDTLILIFVKKSMKERFLIIRKFELEN